MTKPEGLLDYINGDKFDQQAPEDLKYAAGGYLNENPLPEKMENLSEGQAEALSFLHNEFIKEYPVIPEHIQWHSQYGSGGISDQVASAYSDEKIGEEFLRLHRRMLEDENKYINKYAGSEQNLPVWDELSTNIADKFPLATGVELNPQENLIELAEENPSPIELISDSEAMLKVPGYLTVKGGEESYNLDGKEINSLNDIDSMNELGIVMGESWFHANGHVLMGGTMSNGFDSPRAPQFYGWHKKDDQIADQWLDTEKGQAWYNSPDADGWKKDEEASKLTDFAGNFRTFSPTVSPAPSTSMSPSSAPTISLPPSLSPSDIPSLPPSVSYSPSDSPSQAPSIDSARDSSENMGVIAATAGGAATAMFAAGLVARYALKKWTNRVNSQREQQNNPEVDVESQSRER